MCFIEFLNNKSENEINEIVATETILNEVYEKYAQYSACKLSDMTHHEEPWKLTEKSKEIPKELMGCYFKRELNEANHFID